ncbi:MAG: PEP-CTERM sorting domain-containing protein [Gemmatimonadales bacterium]|nr:PEP-CTERM sorting domain-containing protein [Gemmatimonadales bacterium]
MSLFRSLVAAGLLATVASPAVAAPTYSFDILYFGGGVASVAGGSTDPFDQVVADGESFFWSISAENSAFWRVDTGGSFFPLMAFSTLESGRRTGDFALRLLRNGASVFTLSELGSQQSCVHMGTNTVNLGTGLTFDRMEIDFTLTSAVGEQSCGTPDGQPLTTTIRSRLPIFGAPEQNRFFPGISYQQQRPPAVVPEPGTLVLLGGGLALVGIARRRR